MDSEYILLDWSDLAESSATLMFFREIAFPLDRLLLKQRCLGPTAQKQQPRVKHPKQIPQKSSV